MLSTNSSRPKRSSKKILQEISQESDSNSESDSDIENKIKHKKLDDSSLFSAIENNASVDLLLNEWCHLFVEDSVCAALEILNLVIASSGCPNQIQRHQIQDIDSITDSLDDLQASFDLVSFL